MRLYHFSMRRLPCLGIHLRSCEHIRSWALRLSRSRSAFRCFCSALTREIKHSAYLLFVPLKNKEDPKRCAHRVYFDDYTGPARTYEISGEPDLEEVTRPVDELKWVNDFTLSYERWAGPHFGHRYVIDVRSKKQVTAYDLFAH